MTRLAPGARRAAAPLLLAALGGACAPAAPPALQRLLPELGPPSFVRLEDETRPAALLRPGETRGCRVRAARGSRLRFALGLQDPPEGGFLHLTVRADGAPVFEGRFAVARSDHWWRRSVALDVSGDVRLEFSVEHRGGASAAARPWIALGSPRLEGPGRSQPGRVLLWISQDTLRADHLSAYGYPRPTAPGLEHAARGWTLFEDASATCSWTLPSLASQLSSRWPTWHGALLHNLALDASCPTLMEVLARDGFGVLGVTANDLVDGPHGLARGFDALIYRDARARELGETLLRLLDEWQGGDLALFVHYMDPHHPYLPPRPFDTRFDPGYEGTVRGAATDFQALSRLRAPRDVAHVRALYDGEIAYADQEIADLLRRLDQRGLLAPAVIAYSADHGEEFLDHGSWHHGGTLYQEVLHVPFALRLPGVPGRRVAAPVSMLDLAPTLLEALGAEAPACFQGRSLLRVARGEAAAATPLFAETALTPDRRQLVAVRDGHFKYVLEVPGGREAQPPTLREQLFDLARDPAESEDRSAADPVTAERLRRVARAYLARGRAEAPRLTPFELDPAALEKLRALGYVQ